uniref:Uncharacterized protein n=1 Tax=Rhizophora mucronata TaxID=61149 RepID=A0A2P2QP21_RHIMU
MHISARTEAKLVNQIPSHLSERTRVKRRTIKYPNSGLLITSD